MFRYNARSWHHNWRFVDGPRPRRVSVSSFNDDLLVLDTRYNAYYFKRSFQNVDRKFSFRRLSKKASFICVAVSGDGLSVWATDKKGNVWFRGGVAGSWQLFPRLKLKQVSVTHHGNIVWGLSASGRLWYLGPNGVSGKWRSLPGSYTQVSVSGDGKHVWALKRGGKIYYRRGLNARFRRMSGQADQISVNKNGRHVYHIRRNVVYYRRGATNSFGRRWQNLGRVRYISVSGNGKSVWAIFTNGRTYYRLTAWRNNVRWQKVYLGRNVIQLSVNYWHSAVWSISSGNVHVRSGFEININTLFSNISILNIKTFSDPSYLKYS